MNRDVFRQILVFLALAGTVVVNGLATALPLNGQDTGQISDQFAIYFVPANYVFSIWGIIYLGLIGYAIYQALPAQRESPYQRATGYWFVLNAFANSIWLFFWHYLQFNWTLVIMLVVLATLIIIYVRLDIGRRRVSTRERLLLHLPFSIYLGWISVATIANVTQVLFFNQWNGWGGTPETWFVLVLAAAVLIGALMTWSRRDIAYVLVLIWAVSGIAIKHAETPIVATSSWIGVALFSVMVIYSLVARLRTPQPA